HRSATILDYLSPSGLLILDNPASIQNHITDYDAQAVEIKDRLERERENPAHLRDAHFSWPQLEPQLQQRGQLRFADILSLAESDFDARQRGETENLMPPFS